jgi:hypothetical protein
MMFLRNVLPESSALRIRIVVQSFETSVNIWLVTGHHIPEDKNLQNEISFRTHIKYQISSLEWRPG